MDPSIATEQLAGTLLVLMLAAILGLVWAVVAGVMLVQGRRVPAVLAATAVAFPAVIGAAGTLWSLQELAVDPVRAIGSAVSYQLVTLFFTLPAAFCLMVCAAVAGWRAAPREAAFGMAAAALAAVAAGVPIMGGYATDDPLYALIRAAVHGVLGVLLVVAALGSGDDEGSGREAAAAAALAYAIVVCLSEASGRGLIQLFLSLGMAGVAPVDQPAFVAVGFEQIVDRRVPYQWIAVVASAAFGLGASIPLVHDPARRLGGATVALAALLVPALFLPGALHADTFTALVGVTAPPE